MLCDKLFIGASRHVRNQASSLIRIVNSHTGESFDPNQIFFEGSESDCLVYLLKGIREYLSGTCSIFDNTEEREEKMRSLFHETAISQAKTVSLAS
jgi:hypothetical protein